MEGQFCVLCMDVESFVVLNFTLFGDTFSERLQKFILNFTILDNSLNFGYNYRLKLPLFKNI